MEAYCRVWSLWDMLIFKGASFYAATVGLHHAKAVAGTWAAERQDEPLKESSRERTEIAVAALIESLRVLDARMTRLAAERLLASLENGSMTYRQYRAAFDEIDSRMRDELSLNSFYVLEDGRGRYFAENLFGPEVANKFPNAAFDIAEAGKCLALGVETGSVFHLMRAMESALRAVHACLGLPTIRAGTDRNWGTLLGAIREEVKRRGKGFPDADYFQSLYALLDAVKDAWRNGTMHVESKYTYEEAEHIFVVVRGFMQKVASRMDEAGLPLA